MLPGDVLAELYQHFTDKRSQQRHSLKHQQHRLLFVRDKLCQIPKDALNKRMANRIGRETTSVNR